MLINVITTLTQGDIR